MNTTSTTAKRQIQFIQNYQTNLDSGTYEIKITQNIIIGNQQTDNLYSQLTFVVQGNRFELKPQDIHAVFPPENSLGDHSHVLPHVVLKSSTLPWERLVYPNAPQDVPWLALILLHDDEKLLRTIDKQDFFNQETGMTENSKKQELWQHLSNQDIGWIKLIENSDEAIIVEKNYRQSQILKGEFAAFDRQIEAILAQSGNIKTVTIEKLEQPSTGLIKWPGITLEVGQHKSDKVSIIDVPKICLTQILPTTEDLKCLAHVRQVVPEVCLLSLNNIQELPQTGKSKIILAEYNELYHILAFDDAGALVINQKYQPNDSLKKELETIKNLANEDEKVKKLHEIIEKIESNIGQKIINEPLSIIVGNRLPKKGGVSTAYLVSLENRFTTIQINDQDAKNENYIRLVVLKSWSFSCSDPEQSFMGLLKNLKKDTLQLPHSNNPDADKYLTKGYVPIHHYLRQGGNTISWYHSPLLPGENPTDINLSKLSIRCADQLIAYNSENGLFDISYAAAWQLGQLLALQDKKLATNLFNWKRANAQKLAKDNQQSLYPHLFPGNTQGSSDSLDFPEDVNIWFKQLGLLSGIPFNYLVPDERMLPPESIRFFWLDWFWVESLLDGAFSIGRVHESNTQLDTFPSQVKQITGFLMRSEVVAGWPDLQIDASNACIKNDRPMEEIEKLKVLRHDRLSEDVLICLFDGEINTVDISLKPEGLHFGFNHKNQKLWRELRYPENGEEHSEWKVEPIPWKEESKRVVNINDLINKIKKTLEEKQQKSEPFTSAQFALQMVQGAEKVRFSR
ncbi:hypothetical protein H6G41_22875 [Tolypothrix sp. FACHB-123]|uniref:hypothetical protein n=1 Tax=Tolypothrix sp. FACHB-123 TaxID=2692868 RepID=UPI0016862498|nr:hypothetical protein [Tolypothrix sp. FACHB-123]MBD2357427.1 hypothetical protein [Tolypothrix sp. FACHB-123]